MLRQGAETEAHPHVAVQQHRLSLWVVRVGEREMRGRSSDTDRQT